MDSARGVAAIVVFSRKSSSMNYCDAIVHSGRRTIAFFLLFGMQEFVCNSSYERDIPNMFQAWSERESHPVPISPLLHTPDMLP